MKQWREVTEAEDTEATAAALICPANSAAGTEDETDVRVDEDRDAWTGTTRKRQLH
jgi:hypothetical protein